MLIRHAHIQVLHTCGCGVVRRSMDGRNVSMAPGLVWSATGREREDESSSSRQGTRMRARRPSGDFRTRTGTQARGQDVRRVGDTRSRPFTSSMPTPQQGAFQVCVSRWDAGKFGVHPCIASPLRVHCIKAERDVHLRTLAG